MLGKGRILGVALSRRSCTAVEVAGGGQVVRAGRLAFGEGLSLDTPAEVGKALKQFLHREGFSASRCVIGLDGTWLTARPARVPAGAASAARAALGLTIEREFASDRTGLVFDYAMAETPDEDGYPVLIVAAPKAVLDRAQAMAHAAGLTVAAITASTLALAASANGQTRPNELVLHLHHEGAELVLRSGGAVRMYRRLAARHGAHAHPGASANGFLADVTDQLRRVVAMLPANHGPAEEGHELAVWDETGLDAKDWQGVSEQVALPWRLCEPPPGLAALGADAAVSASEGAAAAAMAQAAARGKPAPVDLLHSRLAEPKRALVGRRAVWAVAAALAVVGGGAMLWWDTHTAGQDVATLEAKLSDLDGDLAKAKRLVGKVTYARPWYSRDKTHLECMRDLTYAFPQEGTIWTTSLAVQEDLRVVFSGKAVSESAVLDVLDYLKGKPQFGQVQPLYLRQAGKNGREVAFAMSFTYQPSGKP